MRPENELTTHCGIVASEVDSVSSASRPATGPLEGAPGRQGRQQGQVMGRPVEEVHQGRDQSAHWQWVVRQHQ